MSIFILFNTYSPLSLLSIFAVFIHFVKLLLFYNFRGFPDHFDEGAMFTGGIQATKLKEEVQTAFSDYIPHHGLCRM